MLKCIISFSFVTLAIFEKNLVYVTWYGFFGFVRSKQKRLRLYTERTTCCFFYSEGWIQIQEIKAPGYNLPQFSLAKLGC